MNKTEESFLNFEILILDLFRISIFEFRISFGGEHATRF